MLATIPVLIGRQRMTMDVDIVEHEIPLLISKGAMKMMGMKIDFKRDVVIMNQDEIKLYCTRTGHYCISLSSSRLGSEDINVVLHLQNLYGLTSQEKKSKSVKLY